MKRLTPRIVAFLVFDIALLSACLLHIPSLYQRPSAPFTLVESESRFLVATIHDHSACPDLRPGDRIVRWGAHDVTFVEMITFLSDFSSIGYLVPVQYERHGEVATTSVTLVGMYSWYEIVVFLFVALVTWCLAVYTLAKGPPGAAATTLHWAMMSMAVVVVMGWEGGSVSNTLGYVDSILFFLSYLGVASTFFLFTSVFPGHKAGRLRTKATLVYIPAVLLLVVLLFHHAQATFHQSPDEYRTFRQYFLLLHASLFVYIGGGLFNFIHSYFTSTSSEERKKLKWILWGLCTGPTPFLLLTILPDLLAPGHSLPDAFTLVTLVLIPISFAVSFIKHRVLDVELVISRTTVYAIVVGILVSLYAFLVGIVANIVGTLTVEVSTAGAVVVALLFEPVRRKTQRFVDRRFFRVHYNFREAERRFVEDIKHCMDLKALAQLMVSRTDELIPVERIGIFLVQQPGSRLQALAHRGFEQLEKHSIRFEEEKLRTRLERPVAIGNRLEPGINYEAADEQVFRRWGMALVLPMVSEQFESLGFLVLGEKKSGRRFSAEDVDLLSNVATQAGLAIQRITLLHDLVLKEAEAHRLEELNRLKSDFVSYVSHELRTPLTSIKMFTELLRNATPSSGKRAREYLDIIEGESDRLTRMVGTILDSARIDQGVKEYEFREVELCEITERVLATMKYQLDKHKFKVQHKRPARPLHIHADADAVSQALTNLIANAIKYSGQRKFLRIHLFRRDGSIHCTVEDRGLGIPPESIPHLFEKFYRDPTHSGHAQGVGLGLPLVKHILDAHGGSIEVKSTVGKGSRFCLCFPAIGNRNEDAKANSHH